jgi:hypothetical protein
MNEIKRLIATYSGHKISDMVDDVWDEKGWNNADTERILVSDKRTPYNSNS